jgi:hypothetical protein
MEHDEHARQREERHEAHASEHADGDRNAQAPGTH